MFCCVLSNRSPLSAIQFKCPEEKWTKRKPNLEHLRLVGCEAYSHKSDGKLEPRSTRCVFLGYQLRDTYLGGKKSYC